jgi:hypothetical protein
MARLPGIYPRAPAFRPLLYRRRSCPRGPAARRRAPRACGAQPRPAPRLWWRARGGGRAPPRSKLVAPRAGVPAFSGPRDLGRGAREARKARRSSASALSPPPFGSDKVAKRDDGCRSRWGALAEQGEAGSGLGRRPLPCQCGSGAITPVWVS